MYRAIIVATLVLSGCGGSGGSAGNPEPPMPPPPPPPPPVMCEWDDTIPADDPACVEPPPPPPVVCSFTFSWTNPTEDVDNNPLDVDELKAATLYQFRIPMAAPEEVDAIIDAGDPYTTTWVLDDVSAGTWYYRLTVSNHDVEANLQESDHSNEVEKVC